jgi:hypothetical protein
VRMDVDVDVDVDVDGMGIKMWMGWDVVWCC